MATTNNNQLPTLHAAVAQRDEILVLVCLSCLQDVNAKETTFGHTPLHIAVINNDIRLARILLNYEADVDATTNDNLTPLHIAVSNCSMNMITLLLDFGANVNPSKNFQGKTPLYIAVEYGRTDIAWMLVKKNASISKATLRNSTLLHVAARIGDVSMAKLILENVDNDALLIRDNSQNKTAVDLAGDLGHHEIVRLIRQKAREQIMKIVRSVAHSEPERKKKVQLWLTCGVHG